MGETIQALVRCVHCLRDTDSQTRDHVFPSSWYPDSTAVTVQRWTVPCCPECNKFLGKMETDLLVRLALCLDPASEGTAGISSKALRSLGLDVAELDANEKKHRDERRAKIKTDLIEDGFYKPAESQNRFSEHEVADVYRPFKAAEKTMPLKTRRGTPWRLERSPESSSESLKPWLTGFVAL